MSADASVSDQPCRKVPWARLISQNAIPMGLNLSSHQIAQFAFYAEELLKWSAKTNLTAIKAPADIVVKHFLDSLAAADQFADGDRLLDIGTGAGFPGVPLKLWRPSLSVTVIDGSRKKISFVSHLIRSLALDGIRALQTRSEDLRRQEAHRGAYEVVVSRAVSDLEGFVRQAVAFVKPGGRLLAWKGGRADAEIGSFLDAPGNMRGIDRQLLGFEKIDYHLPGLEEKRCLVSIKID
jgi:16S rRNA (guanine527-N7)-methyltransferase